MHLLIRTIAIVAGFLLLEGGYRFFFKEDAELMLRECQVASQSLDEKISLLDNMRSVELEDHRRKTSARDIALDSLTHKYEHCKHSRDECMQNMRSKLNETRTKCVSEELENRQQFSTASAAYSKCLDREFMIQNELTSCGADLKASIVNHTSCVELRTDCYARLEKLGMRAPVLNLSKPLLEYDFVISVDSLSCNNTTLVTNWSIYEGAKPHPSLEQAKPGAVVGVIGKFNVGKTFVTNNLCDTPWSFPEGVDVATAGISIAHVTCGDDKFVVMDSAGLRESTSDINVDPLIRDELQTDILIYLVDYLIVVVDSLTILDQHMISHIMDEVTSFKVLTRARENTIPVVLVHNFQHAVNEFTVENMVNRSLRKVFSEIETRKEDGNLLYYRTPLQNRFLSHFVLGNADFEFGRKHNARVFKQLRSEIMQQSHITTSFKDRILLALTHVLPRKYARHDQASGNMSAEIVQVLQPCDPLRLTLNASVNSLLVKNYSCNKGLFLRWPGVSLSLRKSAFTNFLSLQRSDLRPRWVDEYQLSSYRVVVLELPGCEVSVTSDRASVKIFCRRAEIPNTISRSMPFGHVTMGRDEIPNLRSLEEAHTYCGKIFNDGILLLYFLPISSGYASKLLCFIDTDFSASKPWAFASFLVIGFIMATMKKYWRSLQDRWNDMWLRNALESLRKDICHEYHQADVTHEKLKKVAARHRPSVDYYLQRAYRSSSKDCEIMNRIGSGQHCLIQEDFRWDWKFTEAKWSSRCTVPNRGHSFNFPVSRKFRNWARLLGLNNQEPRRKSHHTRSKTIAVGTTSSVSPKVLQPSDCAIGSLDPQEMERKAQRDPKQREGVGDLKTTSSPASNDDPGTLSEEELDNALRSMRALAELAQDDFEQFCSSVIQKAEISRFDLHMGPIKTLHRMKTKLAGETNTDQKSNVKSLCDLNRATIVCDNSTVMWCVINTLTTSEKPFSMKNKFRVGNRFSAPPCYMVKIGIPLKTAPYPINSWVVEIQVTLRSFAEIQDLCHTVFEIERTAEIAEKCPKCNMKGRLAQTSSSETQ